VPLTSFDFDTSTVHTLVKNVSIVEFWQDMCKSCDLFVQKLSQEWPTVSSVSTSAAVSWSGIVWLSWYQTDFSGLLCTWLGKCSERLSAVISTNYTFLAAVLVRDITSLLVMQQGYGTIYLLILTSLALTLLNVVLV